MATVHHGRSTCNFSIAVDIIGPYTLWPRHILQQLFCADLHYKERVSLASFFFLNGLSQDQMIELLWKCNNTMNARRSYKMWDLYNYWTNEEEGHDRRARYFAYHVRDNKLTDLNLVERRSNVRRRLFGNTSYCPGATVEEQDAELERRIAVAELADLDLDWSDEPAESMYWRQYSTPGNINAGDFTSTSDDSDSVFGEDRYDE